MTFWRNFHRINEDVAFVLGFTLNVLLLVVIMKIKVKSMQKYNILLLQCCCIDMFQVLTSFITKPVLIFNKRNMYYLTNGFLQPIGGRVEIIGVIFWAVSACFCVCSMPVSFIFRYRTVVLNEKISRTFYITSLLVAFFGPFIYGMYVWKFQYLDNGHNTYLAEDALAWLIADAEGKVKAASFCPAVSLKLFENTAINSEQ